MKNVRIIPALLLKGQGLYKGEKFKNHKYIGDPINAVKIFNEKEVDELCFLDITATNENKEPNYKVISEIASECFMPLSYGGGINKFEQAQKLFNIGIEKIVISSSAHTNPNLITELSKHYGAQSIVICIDIKKNLFGKYEVYINSGTKNTKKNPIDFALEMQKLGAGEIILNSIDKDGTLTGFDIDIVNKIASKLEIPLVALGGGANLKDIKNVVETGKASAVAAGSMFVFQGKHKAVLITYPNSKDINELFN